MEALICLEAKEDRKNLSIIWLDLANAYGSVQHKLIDAAMELYHVSEKVQQVVKSYFGGIQIRFTVDDYITAWQRLEKGIVTGCTISPILFVIGMSMLTRAAERERETRGPQMNSGIYQPPIRGFMDNLTVSTTTHIQAGWVLSALSRGLNFKPRKSRGLVLKKGRINRWRSSLLERGRDWELRVDLHRKLLFPNIMETTLRPDAVLFSSQSDTLIAIELTVNCEEAHERKSLKYADLMAECRDRGWNVWLFPVEVGCRGFPAQSVWKLLHRLGICGRARKAAVRQLSEAAEKASCWLWHRREDLCWKPGSIE